MISSKLLCERYDDSNKITEKWYLTDGVYYYTKYDGNEMTYAEISSETNFIKYKNDKHLFLSDDIVIINGQDASYGGLGTNSGTKIPDSQKNNKLHTVSKYNSTTDEYLLLEINSWVPSQYLSLHTSNESTESTDNLNENSNDTGDIKTSNDDAAENNSIVYNNDWFGTSGSSNYDNKNSISWRNLDDELYNNHFINGQCYMKVSFLRAIEYELTKPLNLPIYPEDITFGASTNFANADILGRPGPIAGYISTSDVTTRIVLHLHRELQVPGVLASDINQIDRIIARIQACCYPKRFDDGGLCVPIVTYKFGDTEIIGKQTSFSTKWSGPKIGGSYMEATLDIAISHVPMGIIYFDDVAQYNPRKFI